MTEQKSKLLNLLDDFRDKMCKAGYDDRGHVLPQKVADRNRELYKDHYADKILLMFS